MPVKDKEVVVRPVAPTQAEVWYDKFELRIAIACVDDN
jgi:hypothetical protein